MDTQSEQSRVPPEIGFRVDDLVIDIGRQRVLRNGQEIPLAGLSFDLLLALVRAAPNVLTYDQLMDRVWPAQVIRGFWADERIESARPLTLTPEVCWPVALCKQHEGRMRAASFPS